MGFALLTHQWTEIFIFFTFNLRKKKKENPNSYKYKIENWIKVLKSFYLTVSVIAIQMSQ